MFDTSAHLAARFDPLDQTSEANDPGEKEAESDVPLDLANIAGVGERVREVGQTHWHLNALNGLSGFRSEGKINSTDSSVKELLARRLTTLVLVVQVP